jgi:peptidoglycan/LPS O-acetylase OafA/YrhL
MLMLITDARTPVQPRNVARLPLLKALTSVRFFAALHVALYHFVRPFELWGFLAPVMRAGYVGVSFFFLLSGYILTYSHAAEYEAGLGSARRFWIARVARIYPVYLLSMLVAAVFKFSDFLAPKHILAYVADLLMVQSWSIHLVAFFHITAWSLSVEAFFYLVFPFLILRMRPRSALQGWLTVGGMWALAMAAPAVGLHLYPQAARDGELDNTLRGAAMIFSIKRIPFYALPEFLAGVSLCWLFLRFKPHARLSAPLALAGLAGMVTGLFFSAYLPAVMLHNGLLIPFYALLLLGISYPNWISRLLSAPWLMLLGEASFSLYLVHFLFNDFVRVVFHAGETKLDALWKMAIIIPISIVLHLRVERPGRRMILGWWAEREPAKQSGASAQDVAA